MGSERLRCPCKIEDGIGLKLGCCGTNVGGRVVGVVGGSDESGTDKVTPTAEA